MLTLSFPGEDSIEVPVDLKEDTATNFEKDVCIGNVCGEEVEGRSCGKEVSDWLERVLGYEDVQLVKGLRRKSKRKQATNSLANDSDCLLLNLESINSLAKKVAIT